MAVSVLNIVDGEFALAIVNTEAVGYASSWNTPDGDDVEETVIGDWTGASAWHCQIIDGKITSKANITQRRRDATFCDPAALTPIAAESGFTLEFNYFQDAHVSTGLSKFLFDNDTEEAYFLLGLNGGDPPRAVGRVRVVAADFGGKADEDLKATVRLELMRRPEISFGDGTTSVIVSTPFGTAFTTTPAAKVRNEAKKAAAAASG